MVTAVASAISVFSVLLASKCKIFQNLKIYSNLVEVFNEEKKYEYQYNISFPVHGTVSKFLLILGFKNCQRQFSIEILG